MQLELAENNSNFPYVFVPLRESGIFVHEEKLAEMLSKKGKGKQKVKKLLLAGPRNAFLAIVKLNVKGLATKLAKAINKDAGKVKELWEKKLGGNFNKLITAINVGKKHKQLGAEPVSTTAAIASAAPIIVAVVKLVKSIIGKEGAEDTGGGDIIDNLEKDLGKVTDPSDPKNADQVDKEEEGKGFDLPMPLVIGGLAVVALLMFRKK